MCKQSKLTEQISRIKSLFSENYQDEDNSSEQADIHDNADIQKALAKSGLEGMIEDYEILVATATFVHDYNENNDKMNTLSYLVNHIYKFNSRMFQSRDDMDETTGAFYDALAYFEEYGEEETHTPTADVDKTIAQAMVDEPETVADPNDYEEMNTDQMGDLTAQSKNRFNEQIARMKQLN